MAKAAKKQGKAAPAPAKGDKGKAKSKEGGPGLNRAVMLVLVAALVPFAMPTFVVVAATMLPTVAAYFSERGSNRYAWLCIGGFNFAGIVYYLFQLWFGVHTVDEALRLLSDGNVLMWAYGVSGLGWLYYKVMPPIVGSWLTMSTVRKVTNLKAEQRKLVEDWGEEVARKPA